VIDEEFSTCMHRRRRVRSSLTQFVDAREFTLISSLKVESISDTTRRPGRIAGRLVGRIHGELGQQSRLEGRLPGGSAPPFRFSG